MDFKDLVMQDIDVKYQNMQNGKTESPFKKKVKLSSFTEYSKKRNEYNTRLIKEKEEFNNSITQLKETKEQEALYEIAIKESKNTDNLRFLICNIIAVFTIAIMAVITFLALKNNAKAWALEVMIPATGFSSFFNIENSGLIGYNITLVLTVCICIIYFILELLIKHESSPLGIINLIAGLGNIILLLVYKFNGPRDSSTFYIIFFYSGLLLHYLIVRFIVAFLTYIIYICISSIAILILGIISPIIILIVGLKAELKRTKFKTFSLIIYLLISTATLYMIGNNFTTNLEYEYSKTLYSCLFYGVIIFFATLIISAIINSVAKKNSSMNQSIKNEIIDDNNQK